MLTIDAGALLPPSRPFTNDEFFKRHSAPFGALLVRRSLR